ncbi:MAG: D-glycero-beta-D-manno-heptose 1-phosphate adenylyltransferase [Ignavibacteriales bacterium]|nr:D-glycero-beta-D-manno-heptose 1-phosphate adenylyltransferase [Ignavibacteriales bacterium]
MISNFVIRERIPQWRESLKKQKKKIVFTNGCFDLLHLGHIDYLLKAKSFGDILIVALNTDESVKRIKGEKRPILPQEERAFIISNLRPVDYVTFFDEDTPEKIIGKILPDVLVKGADWELDKIVGRDIVEANGGAVKRIKFISTQSTTNIIAKILDLYSK